MQVVFLEFFEILIQCAQEWYKSHPVKINESPVAKHELSVPILLITSDDVGDRKVHASALWIIRAANIF